MADETEVKTEVKARPERGERERRRPKKPRPKAVIDRDGCTGCSGSPVCIAFCPVDCIEMVPGPIYPTVNAVCVVDEDRCTGCTICAIECPWETITMYYPSPEDFPKASKFPVAVMDPSALAAIGE